MYKRSGPGWQGQARSSYGLICLDAAVLAIVYLSTINISTVALNARVIANTICNHDLS